VASRSIEKGEAAIKEIEAKLLPGSVSLIQLDVTDDESINNAVAKVDKEFGHLDILINNAGIQVYDDSPLSNRLRKTFETNSIAPAVVSEAFLPLLKNSTRARLIYVGSGLGSIARKLDKNWNTATALSLPYRMSKAALNMLIAYDHIELEPFGIKVHGVCPGYVVTNLSGTGEKGIQQRKEKGAGSPASSGQFILSIVEGKRDRDAGTLVYKDGVHPW
jgi:NAD(P)-dependent dehydrogenase (short-subunit alcohol dehydrogenase family)